MATDTIITGIGGVGWGGLATIDASGSEGAGVDDGSGDVTLSGLPTARILELCDNLVVLLNADADITGTGVSFARGYSFGFQVDEVTGMPLQPTTLQLIIRPLDLGRKIADRESEDRFYTVQIGAFKMVNKRQTTESDLILNLMAAVANLFHDNYEVVMADDGKLTVIESRFVPLFMHDARTMDAHNEDQVLFDCRLQLMFQEIGRDLTDLT